MRTSGRIAIVLGLLAGCERAAGPTPDRERPPIHRRAELDAWVLASLPTRGVMYIRSGLGATGPVHQTIAVDFDRDVVHLEPWEGAPSDKPITAAQHRQLADLAAAIRRRPPPAVTNDIADLLDTFVIADGEDVFYVAGGMELDHTSLRDVISVLQDVAGVRR
ncbi:MAG TPA: hypothetical protein VFQ53_02005 [Kofleriaceae bacterium]|nr:hypothetical protein [Kofleriaceae bacterium]